MSKRHKTFGDEIRQAVRESELSVYRICKLGGLDKAAMSNFLSAKRGISLESLNRLAVVLDLHLCGPQSLGAPLGKPQIAADSTRAGKPTRRSAKVSKGRGAAQGGRRRRATKGG